MTVRRSTIVMLAVALSALPVPVIAASPSPSPSATTPAATAGPPVTCPNPHGGRCLGPLSAGTYTTSRFVTPITYTVPDGWANHEDLYGNFLLLPPGSTVEAVDAGMADYIGIYQGVAIAAEDCASRPEVGVGTTPDEMAAALTARAGLRVTEPVAVEVGGLPGLMIDIAADTASGGGCVVPDLATPIVPLIIGAGPASLEHAQLDGFTTRLYLLEHDLTNIVIEVSDVTDVSGVTADYEPVIDSLVFGD